MDGQRARQVNGWTTEFVVSSHELGVKKLKGKAPTATTTITSNQELANELHKQIIIKFQKHKVYSCFINNI